MNADTKNHTKGYDNAQSPVDFLVSTHSLTVPPKRMEDVLWKTPARKLPP